MSIRVLLVDDERLVRAGFRMILADEPGIDVVGEAADGREAITAAERLRPDVAVMDIRMPAMDGIEATRRLTALPAGPRVLVLTTFDADEAVVEALRAGASGFLLKDAEPEVLLEAIRVIAAGDALLAPSVTRTLLDRVARRLPSTRPQPPIARFAELTARELDVLRLVAAGCSNREIAEQLSLAEPTVKTHVSHVLLKLDLRDRAQLVVLAYEAGLVVPGALDLDIPHGSG